MPVVRAVAFALATAALLHSQTTSPLRTGYFQGRPVVYRPVGNFAVVQGDILLSRLSEIQPIPSSVTPGRDSATYTPPVSRWPNGTLYYSIDADLPNPQRVLDAIQHWNTHTPLKILPRVNETDYVRFTRATLDESCYSYYGMRGGEQPILTTDACQTGNLIHEIGHAFGLLHEHTRADRNAHVTVLYENIDTRFYSNFDQWLSTTADAGYYDYDSVMHYPANGFSRNGLDSLETVPIGIPIGQRDGLSAGDIDSVSRLYGIVPSSTTITTTPGGLQITVDGVTATAPQSYTWRAGSQHTISITATQGDDPRYKWTRWTDGGGATHAITASPDQTVYCAYFVRQHRLSVNVAGKGGTVAIVPVSPDGYYAERSPVQLIATPATGYRFLSWTGPTNLPDGSPLTEVQIPDAEFIANFTSAPVTTIDSDAPGRTITIDGQQYLTPARFSWPPGSSHAITIASPQYFGNNTGRAIFAGWADGSPDSTRTIVASTEDTTYTAGFRTQYLLTTDVTGDGSGSVAVTPATSDGFYDSGTAVQITAQPAANSSFAYWLGDLSGGAGAQPVTMNAQRTVVADFSTGRPSLRVVNGASYLGNPVFDQPGSAVAPREIITLFGENVAGPILFDGTPATILYASAHQTAVVVPDTVAGQPSTSIQTPGSSVQTPVVDTAPALFTADSSGQGQLAALNQDTSPNSPAHPAAAGSIVVLYATGGGLPTAAAPVFVRIGKFPAEVLFAGAAPGQIGLMQINARVPSEVPPNPRVPVQLIVGACSSPPGVSIAIR